MGDSEAGSIISFGAVAVIAVLGYRKLSEFFGGSSSSSSSSGSSGGSSIVEKYIETKVTETVKDATTVTGSDIKNAAVTGASVAANASPFGQAAIIGAKIGASIAAAITGQKEDTKTATAANGISKTYGTGDAAYDKYVDNLTDQWTANIEKTQAQQASIKTAQAGIDALAAGYKAAQSGQESFTVNGTKYTALVTAPKTGTSSSGSSSIKRTGGSGTGEDKVRIIKKVA